MLRETVTRALVGPGESAIGPRRSGTRKRTATGEAPASRERWTIYVLSELADELRNAAYWIPGATLSGMIEEGMFEYLMKLRRKRNGGKPFEPRTGELPLGRPRK